jgi:hypothetical protein
MNTNKYDAYEPSDLKAMWELLEAHPAWNLPDAMAAFGLDDSTTVAVGVAHLHARANLLPVPTTRHDAAMLLAQYHLCSVCGTTPCKAFDQRWGSCPECHGNNGYINNGNNHWFLCNEHKTKWCIGANLFSSCMSETLEQQRAEQEKIGFDSYTAVEPYHAVSEPWVDDDPNAEDMSLENIDELDLLDSDVKDVQFGDPKLMKVDTEDGLIEEFIRNYPYQEFTYICRKLPCSPAEALNRILPHVQDGNGWYTGHIESESLKAEAERLTAEGWEPGIPPTKPLTKAQLYTLLRSIFKVKLDLDSPWSLYDMAYRMGLPTDGMVKLLVDYTVSTVLGHFKYIGDCKWLLSPEEIGKAAANCEWIHGYPAFKEFEGTGKQPSVPYKDYCPNCAVFYNSVPEPKVPGTCGCCGARKDFK